jgi:hypothetical protein
MHVLFTFHFLLFSAQAKPFRMPELRISNFIIRDSFKFYLLISKRMVHLIFRLCTTAKNNRDELPGILVIHSDVGRKLK